MKTLNVLFSSGSMFSMIASIILYFLIGKKVPWLYIAFESVVYLAGIILIMVFAADKNNPADQSTKKLLGKFFLGSNLSYLLQRFSFE